MIDPTVCTCPHDTRELLCSRITGTAEHCPLHDPTTRSETPQPLALNDFDGLAQAIAAKVNPTESGDHS